MEGVPFHHEKTRGQGGEGIFLKVDAHPMDGRSEETVSMSTLFADSVERLIKTAASSYSVPIDCVVHFRAYSRRINLIQPFPINGVVFLFSISFLLNAEIFKCR